MILAIHILMLTVTTITIAFSMYTVKLKLDKRLKPAYVFALRTNNLSWIGFMLTAACTAIAIINPDNITPISPALCMLALTFCEIRLRKITNKAHDYKRNHAI